MTRFVQDLSRGTWVVAPLSADTRAQALDAELPRHRVDATLADDIERTIRAASATLGMRPPKVRYLPRDIRSVRGVVYERPDEMWVVVQPLDAMRHTALHELRHCWGLQDGRYEAIGLVDMPSRQRDADDFAARWAPSAEMKGALGEQLRHRTSTRPLDVKAATGGWEIAGYASVWADSPDSYGDVIAQGAFTRSIATRTTRFLFEHHTPIGNQLELKEDAVGLFGRWSVVDTQMGTDARKLALAGVCAGLSIGYVPLDSERRRDGTRLLTQIDLYEVSLVSVPAQPLATVTSVKSALSESNGATAPPAPARIDLREAVRQRQLRRRHPW